MAEQLEFPRARRTDPRSSHEAADKAERTGAIAAQQRIALRAVNDYPGLTSKQLSGLCPLDRYALARRLPELADGAHPTVRPPREERRAVVGEIRWYPLKPAPRPTEEVVSNEGGHIERLQRLPARTDQDPGEGQRGEPRSLDARADARRDGGRGCP